MQFDICDVNQSNILVVKQIRHQKIIPKEILHQNKPCIFVHLSSKLRWYKITFIAEIFKSKKMYITLRATENMSN